VRTEQAQELDAALAAHTGRFADKQFDWHAFPSNEGFEELSRAQMRYIGAGGSPKVGDASTLPPDHFTLSLIYKEQGHYAACHSHEIEESFLVIEGVLVVGWQREGKVVEVRLGPGDMILNAREIPHGFRVDDEQPVLMSISVDVGKPLPPKYHYHPRDVSTHLARAFGAEPGNTLPIDRNGANPLQKLMAEFVVRNEELPVLNEGAGFTRQIYVGPAPRAIAHSSCRKELWKLPPGIGTAPFTRPAEDAYLVLEGALQVGWVDSDGHEAVVELGPRDLVKTPAGQAHWVRSCGDVPASVWCVIGQAQDDHVQFGAG
jgi:mannose-6-phosphate isomerase-like protein (cupin superfamily)